MDRKEFFEAIKDDFFDNDLVVDFESFKDMLRAAVPVFGVLATETIEKEDGGKQIKFIDIDEADFVIAPEGVTDIEDVDTDMTTTILTLHLNEANVITIVEHGFGIFTPANKEKVLLYASFIGKEMVFE